MLIDGLLGYALEMSKGILNISSENAIQIQSGAAFVPPSAPKYWCGVGLNCCPRYLGEVVVRGKSGVLFLN